MATYDEAKNTLQAALDVVDAALAKAESDEEHTRLLALHNDLFFEIRTLIQKRLNELVGDYKPLTDELKRGIETLKKEKQRIVALTAAAKKADEALAILAKAIKLVV